MNDFPIQILEPPRKGVKEQEFLLVPWGVRKYLLSGSKRSGMNLCGSIHSSLLLQRPPIEMPIVSPLRMVSGPHVVFSLILTVDEMSTGGYILSDSLKQLA